CQQGVTFPLTF
nr:immunoglobulin light chain junction region [Macaca mulatta]